MLDKDTEVLLNRKNTNAVQQTLQHLSDKVYEQHQRIDGLMATISTLADKINKLELMIQIHKATTFGHGPSVK